MLNYLWLGLVVMAVLIGGYNQVVEEAARGGFNDLVKGGFDMARAAVMDIALPLSAIMTIWLGVMRLAEKSGLVLLLARALKPVLRWIFPEVPADHPAMGSIVMNVAANMLGLGNAATPLGLRAMAELQKLNPIPGTATNSMCTFLAINTASVQLIPATAVGLLAVNGGKNPTVIVGTAFLATVCAQIAGLTAVKTFQKWRLFRAEGPGSESAIDSPAPSPAPIIETIQPMPPISSPGKALLLLFLSFFAYLFLAMLFPALRPGHSLAAVSDASLASRAIQAVSLLAIPFFLSFFPLYAAVRQIKVYEEFVEGAKEGFAVAVRIIPYLVTIMAAIGMFRGAHGIELVARILNPLLSACHFPPELLSLAFMRPLSGSGSIALAGDIIKTYGPDHLYSLMGATILGSTETTFYVLAVYFGAVGIRRTRHAMAAGLVADAVGIIASVAICQYYFSR